MNYGYEFVNVRSRQEYGYQVGRVNPVKAKKGYIFEKEFLLEYVFDNHCHLTVIEHAEGMEDWEVEEFQQDIKHRISLKSFQSTMKLIGHLAENEQEADFVVEEYIPNFVIVFHFTAFDSLEATYSVEEDELLFRAGSVQYQIENIEIIQPTLIKRLLNHPKVRLKRLFE